MRCISLLRTVVLIGAAAITVAACATDPHEHNADPEVITRSAYRNPAEPSMTLITMVNNRSGQGGHTALMVNASQAVIFDPAGSFFADTIPELDDVLYGISPQVFQAYRSAHARSTHHVVSQTIPLTHAQADFAYNLVTTNGRVSGAYCARATSGILQQIPGFEEIKPTFFPVKLQEQFQAFPGVQTELYREDDDADLKTGIAESNAALNDQP